MLASGAPSFSVSMSGIDLVAWVLARTCGTGMCIRNDIAVAPTMFFVLGKIGTVGATWAAAIFPFIVYRSVELSYCLVFASDL